MKHAGIVWTLLVLLTGCTTFKDISIYRPYKDYVGQTATLVRPFILEEWWNDKSGETVMIYANPDGSKSEFALSHVRKNSDRVLKKAGWGGEDMYLTRLEKIPITKSYTIDDYSDPAKYKGSASVVYPKDYAMLIANYYIIPVGTKVKIEKVSNVVHFEMGQSVSATLSFKHPVSGEMITAGYTWGEKEYLHRAHWEGDHVPEKRFVGYSGRGYKND